MLWIRVVSLSDQKSLQAEFADSHRMFIDTAASVWRRKMALKMRVVSDNEDNTELDFKKGVPVAPQAVTLFEAHTTEYGT